MEQLIKRNCDTGEYSDIYPVTVLSAVKDPKTGDTLDVMLEKYNHIYLPFKGNSRTYTRLQVPPRLRKKGLWITYVPCNGTPVTEWYEGNDFRDAAWGNGGNWVPYLNPVVIRNSIKEILAWYKA